MCAWWEQPLHVLLTRSPEQDCHRCTKNLLIHEHDNYNKHIHYYPSKHLQAIAKINIIHESHKENENCIIDTEKI